MTAHVQIAASALTIAKYLKGNERPWIKRYYCSCASPCPLWADGNKCINTNLFDVCLYGKVTQEEGPTKRANSFSDFVARARAEAKRFPHPEYPPQSMAYIGDYVWLPYAHMDMPDNHSGFYRETSFGRTGIPFLPVGQFTAEWVVRICKCRPQAMMGGEITSYQKESVPKFLVDLKRADPSLFQAAVELEPKLLDKMGIITNNYAGKKAKLRYLPEGTVGYLSHQAYWNPEECTLETTETPIGIKGSKSLVAVDPDMIVTITKEMAEKLNGLEVKLEW